MSSGNRHIVIVGAGHAGGRAAETLRAAGHPGRVTLVGSEAHPPYERPPLSKELLAGTIAHEKTYLNPATFYTEKDITLRLGATVAAIDRTAQRIELGDGSTIPYDALLLTTGARARRLPLPGGDGQRVFYLRDIADSLALRERLGDGTRLAVIGAGFIGLEVAATARKRGAAVTVLELAPHPLARVAAPEIGEFLAQVHRANGVDLATGVKVTAIEDTGAELRVIADGAAPIPADYVAVGIGAQPNSELAQAAGLETRDGIIVDQFGHTNDPAIFAAGDVTRHFNPILGRHIRLEAWQNAQNQGIAVAKIMAGGAQPFAEVPWFWTDQYNINLQMAGAPDRWDRIVWRGLPSEPGFTLFQLLGGKVVAAVTVNNAREMRFGRALIQSGKIVDPALLGDKAAKLQDLVR
ncbi:MAG TPA: FAD-dependent oxidoreductase [Stellaceae bacterium]|nr:FAD-dependent oxidoreductase [Stellaceae bacterium]